MRTLGFLALIILFLCPLSNASAERSAQNILLLQPLPGQLLDLDTYFQWATVEGVNEYQLEFFHTESKTSPIMNVPAQTNEVYLPVLTRQKLQAGKSYLWRVIGVNDSGVVIAKSEFRRFTVNQP